MKKSYIWITTEKENYHQWKNAPDEVDFLRNLHRHLFKFKIYVSVNHDDRDIEFFIFKRIINKMLEKTNEWQNMSCEMIADWLYSYLSMDFPERNFKIEVSEDGENGCYVEY